VNNCKFDIFIHLIFLHHRPLSFRFWTKNYKLKLFTQKKSSRSVDMFLTLERKPSFPIPKAMLDKSKDDDNDVKMDDNQSDSKMSFGYEEDNLSYAVDTGDNVIHSDQESSDDDKSDTSKHR